MIGHPGRSLPLAGLGVILALLLAIAAVLSWRALPSQQGAALDVVPLAADKSLGINANLSGLDAWAMSSEVRTMEAYGFRWLRYRFAWDQMEPRRGSYNWEESDRVVEAARQAGISLIAVLDGAPAWARAPEDRGSRFAPPVEVRDYGDWVQAFVERYGDIIDHYQIWNEPNIAPHWGSREVDPAAYARLLRESSIRIRAGDPGAVVLVAALAPNVEPGGANMSDILYLDRLYQAGAAPWFDVVAGQTYPFHLPLETPPSAGELSWRRLELLRQVMLDHGDGETAMWVVSWGIPGLRALEEWGHVAEQITRAVQETRLDWPWLGPMLWAAWTRNDRPVEYALLTGFHRGAVTGPALDTLRTMAEAPPVAWPGVYPPDHASGQYEGAWRVTSLAADIGATGDRLTVTFRGTRFDLYLRRGPYRAFLYVTVDGAPANALPRDGVGRAYVVLYDPLNGSELLNVARDLADAEHTVEIVAEGGWGQWAIAGWGVSRETPSKEPAWLPAAFALGSLAAFSAAAAATRPWWRTLGAWLSRPASAWLVLAAKTEAMDDRWLLATTAAVALLLYVVPGLLPSLALLAILALLLLLRPWLGLPLIAVALPFYQLGKPLLGKVFSMVEILTLLTAAAWAVGLILKRLGAADRGQDQSGGRGVSVLDLGVAALVLLSALSLLWAQEGRVAARELRTVVLESALFYALLRALIRRRAAAWLLVDAWVLGAALIAALGIGQWILGEGVITAEGVSRVRGFYGSPNNLALYLGRAFPLALALAAFWPAGRTGGLPGVAGSRGRRWLYTLAAVLMGLGLLLTYSRGAWLAGIPASLLVLATLRGRRTLAVAAVVFTVVAMLSLAAAGTGRLASLLETEQGTTFFRLQLWRSSLAMIRDHPILGVGLDNFLYQYRSHYVLPTAWEEFNLSHPHNLVLDFWLRLGLGGLAVLAWLLVGFFWRGLRLYRSLPEGPDSLLVAGLMAGMVNFLAHGLVDNAFFLVDLAFVFMLMLALMQLAFPALEPANPRSANIEPTDPGSTNLRTYGGQETACVS
jgi:O-antigen ligase